MARGIDWDAQPLGKVPDSEIAEALGFASTTPVRNARAARGIGQARHKWEAKGIDWDAQPLGEIGDAEIARALGVSKATAQRARTRRGISAKRIDWDSQPLGDTWDIEIAEQLGTTWTSVAQARRLRGIARYENALAKCACGDTYVQRLRCNRWCSTRCYHAYRDAVRSMGVHGKFADLHVAIVALRREVRQRRKDNVEID